MSVVGMIRAVATASIKKMERDEAGTMDQKKVYGALSRENA